MTLDELLRSPWFYSSPGPLSLAYYGIIIFLGARILLRRGAKYKREKWRWIFALTDSFFINGFIVLSGDLLWITVCAARFLSVYPIETFRVACVFGRNSLGMVLCYMLVGQWFKQKIVSFKKSTFFAYVLLTGFFVVNFLVAPDPSWTDWTLAIRWGQDTTYILASLIVSYGVGKTLGTILFWTWWKNPEK
jgi:hypothetical protein